MQKKDAQQAEKVAGAATMKVLKGEAQGDRVAALIEELPGLVGAIDAAIYDKAGTKLPFTLLIYGPGGAMYASNFDAKDAAKAMADVVAAGGIGPVS